MPYLNPYMHILSCACDCCAITALKWLRAVSLQAKHQVQAVNHGATQDEHWLVFSSRA